MNGTSTCKVDFTPLRECKVAVGFWYKDKIRGSKNGRVVPSQHYAGVYTTPVLMTFLGL